MKIITALLCLFLFSLPVALRAQNAVADKIQKGDKTLISVPVIVSDREGRYIPGLKKEDFTIFQDGAKQNIAYFATEDEPLNIALLLDTSGSTKDVLDKIKDAATDFIELLNPSDQCLVATFDSQLKVLNQLTSNRETLKSSVGKIQTAEKDGTVMFRAVEQTLRESFAKVQGRKVIVLLSDGKDIGSAITKEQLLNLLEESDVMIYSVFYQTGLIANKLVIDSDGTVKESSEKIEVKKPEKKNSPKKKKGYTIFVPLPGDTLTEEEIKRNEKLMSVEAINSLREMSDLTAGRFYQSDSPNLSGIFKKVAGELRQQYRLGFYSKDSAEGVASHEISVKVERQDVVVRARGKFRAKDL
jgi:VWFA-related protein